MPNEIMNKKVEITIKNSSQVFGGSDTKTSIVAKLGKPEDVGGFFGKGKVLLISKYVGIEFHFSPEGNLVLIYKENETGTAVINENFE